MRDGYIKNSEWKNLVICECMAHILSDDILGEKRWNTVGF